MEKKYPEDYKNIERSLYPLIAEAKKDEPTIVIVKRLLDETKKKLTVFQEKIGRS